MRYRGAYRFVRVNVLLWWWEWQKLTVAKIFSRQATANPEKIAFIFEDKEWTYKEVSWINYRCAARGDLNPLWFAPQLEEYSNRIGRYFAGKSLSREDSVGLIMESRPEYVGIWLGLSKAGLVGALLNTNLRQDVLVHSIKAANCKAVIFGSNFKDGKLMNLGKKVSELFKGVGSTAIFSSQQSPKLEREFPMWLCTNGPNFPTRRAWKERSIWTRKSVA